MEKPPDKKIDGLMVLVFVFVALGAMSLMVYMADSLGVEEEIVALMFFTLIGAVAMALDRRGGRGFWRFLAALAWCLALIAAGVFLNDDWGMDPALVMGVVFPSMGLLLYTLFRKGEADGRLLNTRIEWERLGDRKRREETPAERDRAR
jgi:peptidoglycan/LPS O-acetylase OafA/YrhL